MQMFETASGHRSDSAFYAAGRFGLFGGAGVGKTVSWGMELIKQSIGRPIGVPSSPALVSERVKETICCVRWSNPEVIQFGETFNKHFHETGEFDLSKLT